MKLIFFDIDGTLIDHTGKASESTVQAIIKARENGHLCLVNTGRTACLVTNWLPEVAPFDGYLCGCGTNIIFRGQELLHHTFTVEEGKRIIAALEKYKIDAILEGADNDFHNDIEKMHTEIFRNYIIKHSPGKGWESYREAPGRFDKFYCYCDIPGNVIKMVEENADLLDLIDREQGFYEIVPKGFSKASCMDFLIDYLNDRGVGEGRVTLEDTAAIGDSNNDLPMLTHAHTAIAMGESSQAVLEIADFVTTDVAADGIYRALDKLGVL